MFRVTIVTPERPFFDADCRSLIVPGSEGYLGVLTDHAPLITALVPGEIKVVEVDGEAERHFALSGGFFEVARNHVTVLADAVEEPGKIDLDRARRAVERARKRLDERLAGTDLVRAERALLRAQNRLDIARRLGIGSP